MEEEKIIEGNEAARKSFGEALSEYLEAQGAAADEGIMPVSADDIMPIAGNTATGQMLEVYASKTEADAKALASTKPGAMCFTTDTHRIVFNGVAYGGPTVLTDVKEVQAAAMSQFFPDMMLIPTDSPRIWMGGMVRGDGTSTIKAPDLAGFKNRTSEKQVGISGGTGSHSSNEYEEDKFYIDDSPTGVESRYVFTGSGSSSGAFVKYKATITNPSWSDKKSYRASLFRNNCGATVTLDLDFYGSGNPGASLRNLECRNTSGTLMSSTGTEQVSIPNGKSVLVVDIGSGSSSKGYRYIVQYDSI